MHNMSDIIEQYLKQLLEEAQGDVVEIKRAHIAEKFDCIKKNPYRGVATLL